MKRKTTGLRSEESWTEHHARIVRQLAPWSNIDTGRSFGPNEGRRMEKEREEWSCGEWAIHLL